MITQLIAPRLDKLKTMESQLTPELVRAATTGGITKAQTVEEAATTAVCRPSVVAGGPAHRLPHQIADARGHEEEEEEESDTPENEVVGETNGCARSQAGCHRP